MDAGWIVVAALSLGVSLDGMPEDQAEQVQREAARSLTDDLYVTGVVLPHVGDPETNRHTTFQPVTSGQLESGFAQAGSGTNSFGQTLQQGATNAQQAFGATQQQFSAAANEAQTTIGSEVREGASRFLGRAGDALERTGDAIGGTARRFRDGIRNALPGRNNPAPQVNVAPPSPSGFPTFPVQQPTAPAIAPPFAASAPVALPPLPTTTAASPGATAPGASLPQSGFGATSPALGFPSPTVPPQNTLPATTSATTPVTNPPPSFSSPNFQSPVANNQQPQQPGLVPINAGSFPPPTTAPVTTEATTPVTAPTTAAAPENDAFFNSTNSFGHPSSTTTPVVPPAQAGFRPTSQQLGGFANTSSSVANPNGFRTRPNQLPNQQQLPPTQQASPGFSQSGLSQPSTNPWLNASVPTPSNPFGQTVGRPTGAFNQLPPTGAMPNGQLSAPFQTAGQQPGPGGTAFDLPPTPEESNQPWRSLVLATLVAVGSVGGNLFLGWSYLDARNKYRSALRRTTQAFGRVSLSGE